MTIIHFKQYELNRNKYKYQLDLYKSSIYFFNYLVFISIKTETNTLFHF